MKAFLFWAVTFVIAAGSSYQFEIEWPVVVWLVALVTVYVGPQVPIVFDIFD